MAIGVQTGDVLEFVCKGYFDNAQEVINVYHYSVAVEDDTTLEQFAYGLMIRLSQTLMPLLAGVVVYTEIQASILDENGHPTTGTNIIVPADRGTGTASGEALPPYVTWTFKLQRPDSSFRHGWKRYSGVTEANQNKGFPASGIVSALNTHALMLAEEVSAWDYDYDTEETDELTGTGMTPVIIQRVYHSTPVLPVNVGDVLAASYNNIGTQNSRKYGRGS